VVDEPSPVSGEGSSRDGSAALAMITSRGNALIRELRGLVRSPTRRAARVPVEGWRVLAAAAEAGVRFDLAVYTPESAADPRRAALRDRLRSLGAREVVVSPEVFAALTQVEAPQGALGIAARPAPPEMSQLAAAETFAAVLDGVQDPGNVGAIVRTAAAAGATVVVTAGSAADPFGPKALRASAGAAFRVPSCHFETAAAAAAALADAGVRLIVADPHGGAPAATMPFLRPLALVFGNEGAGADAAWQRAGAALVRVPTAGAVESLNVAAAAALLLYRAAGLM